MLILSHWPHIGPVPGATLGCLWEPGGLPKGFLGKTPDVPNRFLGVPLGCFLGPGLPRGAGGLKETTRATQKGPPAAMSISLRRNVHAVEARSPYWSKEGAGRTRLTC